MEHLDICVSETLEILTAFGIKFEYRQKDRAEVGVRDEIVGVKQEMQLIDDQSTKI